MNLEDILTKNDLPEIKKFIELAVSKITPAQASPWLNIKQAADYIGKKPCYIRKKAHQHEIAYIRDGKEMMFKRADLDTYMESKRIKTSFEIEVIAAGR